MGERSDNKEFDVCQTHESQTELLAAMLEHACIQVSARETSARKEGSILQQLRTELEVAQRKDSEKQKAALELQKKLHHEEAKQHELEESKRTAKVLLHECF